MQLEKSPTPPSNGALPHGLNQSEISLDKVVDESRSRIHAEQNPTQTVKRGRGRPRKIAPEATGPSVGQSPQAKAPEIDVTPILRQLVQFPFNIAAVRTRCDALAVTDDEATSPAVAANQLLNIYLPDIEKANPKTAALYVFLISFGMLTVQKMTVYTHFQAERRRPAVQPVKPTDETQKTEAPAPAPDFSTGPRLAPGSIPAQDAFRRENIFGTGY